MKLKKQEVSTGRANLVFLRKREIKLKRFYALDLQWFDISKV